MSKLQKQEIKKIVPQFTMKARNICHIITNGKAGFSKNCTEHLYKTQNGSIFSIDELKQNIEIGSKLEDITWWSIVELNENDYEVYIKAHIAFDNYIKYFKSDNKLMFFLKYNADSFENFEF